MPSTSPPEFCEGGDVVFRLLGFNAGRGYCRARIFESASPSGMTLGPVLMTAIPSPKAKRPG